MIDMLVAAAHIQQEDYYGKANWKAETLLDEKKLPVRTVNAAKHAETAVNAIVKGSRLLTPVGGGVEIQPRQALASNNLLRDEGGKVSGKRSEITLAVGCGADLIAGRRLVQLAVTLFKFYRLALQFGLQRADQPQLDGPDLQLLQAASVGSLVSGSRCRGILVGRSPRRALRLERALLVHCSGQELQLGFGPSGKPRGFVPPVAACESRADIFHRAGCVVENAEPDFTGATEAFETLRALSFLGRFGPLLKEHRDKLKDTVLWNIEQGMKLTPEKIARAAQLRTTLFHRMRTFLERYEFLLCPVNQLPPFPAEIEWPREIDGTRLENYLDWMKSCYYITITSHPAISVPAGFTPDGLPVGLQIVGRYRADFSVLQLAHAF